METLLRAALLSLAVFTFSVVSAAPLPTQVRFSARTADNLPIAGCIVEVTAVTEIVSDTETNFVLGRTLSLKTGANGAVITNLLPQTYALKMRSVIPAFSASTVIDVPETNVVVDANQLSGASTNVGGVIAWTRNQSDARYALIGSGGSGSITGTTNLAGGVGLARGTNGGLIELKSLAVVGNALSINTNDTKATITSSALTPVETTNAVNDITTPLLAAKQPASAILSGLAFNTVHNFQFNTNNGRLSLISGFRGTNAQLYGGVTVLDGASTFSGDVVVGYNAYLTLNGLPYDASGGVSNLAWNAAGDVVRVPPLATVANVLSTATYLSNRVGVAAFTNQSATNLSFNFPEQYYIVAATNVAFSLTNFANGAKLHVVMTNTMSGRVSFSTPGGTNTIAWANGSPRGGTNLISEYFFQQTPTNILADFFDRVIGIPAGTLLVNDGTNWVPLAAGSAGQVLCPCAIYPFLCWSNSSSLGIGGSGTNNTFWGATNNPFSAPFNIIIGGDSISDDGDGVSPRENRYSWFFTNSFSKYRGLGAFTNIAVGGYTIAQMDTDYASKAVPYAPATTGTPGLYCLWIGANNFYSGNPYSTITALSNSWKTAKADGFRLLVIDLMPRTDFFSSGSESNRQVVNKFIRESTIPDYFVSADSMCRNPFDASVLIDGVHPASNFSARVMFEIDAALRAGPRSHHLYRDGLRLSQIGYNNELRSSDGQLFATFDSTNSSVRFVGDVFSPSITTNSGGSGTGFEFNVYGSTTNYVNPIAIFTNAIPTNVTVLASGYVTGGGQTNYASFQLDSMFRRLGSTVVFASSNDVTLKESIAILDSWFCTNGNNIELRVRGQTNEAMNWHARGWVHFVTNGLGVAGASLTPDIVWWKLNENTGTTAADSSTRGTNTLVLDNASMWTTGNAGSGIAGNGSSLDAAPAIATEFGTNILTITFWVKDAAWADNEALVDLSGVGNNTFGIENSSTALAAFVAGTGVTFRYETISLPSTGAFHHILAVVDHSTTPGDVKIYLDGSSQSTTIAINDKANSAQFAASVIRVFSRDGSTFFSNATIDDVRIYSGDRSADAAAIFADPQ